MPTTTSRWGTAGTSSAEIPSETGRCSSAPLSPARTSTTGHGDPASTGPSDSSSPVTRSPGWAARTLPGARSRIFRAQPRRDIPRARRTSRTDATPRRARGAARRLAARPPEPPGARPRGSRASRRSLRRRVEAWPAPPASRSGPAASLVPEREGGPGPHSPFRRSMGPTGGTATVRLAGEGEGVPRDAARRRTGAAHESAPQAYGRHVRSSWTGPGGRPAPPSASPPARRWAGEPTPGRPAAARREGGSHVFVDA